MLSEQDPSNPLEDPHLRSGAIPIYDPEPFDVLLGRGQAYVTNPGNRRLQCIVDLKKDQYDACPTRSDKTRITEDIVRTIRVCGTHPGRFLKFNNVLNCWFETSDEYARLKVSNSMRNTRRASATSRRNLEVAGTAGLTQPHPKFQSTYTSHLETRAQDTDVPQQLGWVGVHAMPVLSGLSAHHVATDATPVEPLNVDDPKEDIGDFDGILAALRNDEVEDPNNEWHNETV